MASTTTTRRSTTARAASASPKITKPPVARNKGPRRQEPAYGHRSSLRRAIRESLRDVSAPTVAAVAAITAACALEAAASPRDLGSSPSSSSGSRDRAPIITASPAGSLSPSPYSRSDSSAEKHEHPSPISSVSAPGLAPSPSSSFSSFSSSPAPASSSPSPHPGIARTPSPSSSSSPSSYASSAVSTPARSGAKKKEKKEKRDSAVVNMTEGVSSTPAPLAYRRGNWHGIKEIVGEGRQRGSLVYLVEWEGFDPNTGVMWPSSWVDAKNISTAAIREWEARKGGIAGAEDKK